MTASTDTDKRKRKKKNTRAIVLKDGVECGLMTPDELGLGSELSFRAGLLVKKPNDPHTFQGEKSAQRFINKTLKTAARLRSAAFEVDKLPRLQPILEPGLFTTRTFKE